MPLAATIPPEFADAWPDRAHCPDMPKSAVAFAAQYAADPVGFFVLTGSYGSGKSWLMGGIANAVVRRHNPTIRTATWLDGPKLAAGIEVDYGVTVPGWRVDRAKTTPLVFLDDFLTGKTDARTLAVWDDIIAARHAARLATVITTNASSGDMAGMGLGRIVSRLAWPHGIRQLSRDDDLRQTGKLTAKQKGQSNG